MIEYADTIYSLPKSAVMGLRDRALIRSYSSPRVALYSWSASFGVFAGCQIYPFVSPNAFFHRRAVDPHH